AGDRGSHIREGPLGMPCRQSGDDRQDSFHPGARPRAVGRKDLLHVHAKMDASFGQRKRQQRVAHRLPLTVFLSLKAIAALTTQAPQRQAMPPLPGQAPTTAIALSTTK